MERIRGEVVAGGPSEAVDCGEGQARSNWRIPRGSGWWTLRSHIHAQINLEEQSGSETDRATPGLQCGEVSLKPLIENPFGVEAAVGETPSLTGEFIGETHRGLERAQVHPLGNQHQRGPV